MSLNLSKEEIDHLFSFTEKKLVRWYDLQVELVDHLACRIEEEMGADSTLTFQAALEKVYSEFGIFGFSKVVQEKESQIYKAAWRMWGKELLLQLSWPKAIGTVVIGLLLYQLTLLVDVKLLMKIFFFAYTISGLGLLKFAVDSLKTSRRILFLQLGSASMSGSSFVFSLMIWQAENVTRTGFLFISLVGITGLIASYQLFLKVKRKAIDMYPEAFAK